MSIFLWLKYTRFDFGWGSAPDPAGGAHSVPPDSLTGFEGVLLLREGRECGGKEGKEREKERGKREKERGKVASWLLGGWTPLGVIMTKRYNIVGAKAIHFSLSKPTVVRCYNCNPNRIR